jgi:VIT1/CCC1 family predicted Fe2+/Mn2+ transporter
MRKSLIKSSIKTGFSFGLTSGIITTLGLMVGLEAGTNSKLVVLGGILTIAIADAFSDALGIHLSEESEERHTALEVWISTVVTFLTKFVIAATFIIPVILFNLSIAIYVSVIYGLSIIGFFSFLIARSQKENPWMVAAEHLIVVVLVVIITHNIGHWIKSLFG